MNSLVAEIQALYMDRKRGLRALLDRARAEPQRWGKIEGALKRVARVPIGFTYGFDWTKGQEEFIDSEDPNPFVGDPSLEVRFAINAPNRRGLDWDRELALACGGRVLFLHIWVSAVLPFYAYDSYYLEFKPSSLQYEVRSVKIREAEHKRIRSRAEQALQKMGFSRLPLKTCLLSVPGATTDLAYSTPPTVFDCLFSDVRTPITKHHRYHKEPYPRLKVLSANVFRLDELDRRGKRVESCIALWIGNNDEKHDYLELSLGPDGQVAEVVFKAHDWTKELIVRPDGPEATWEEIRPGMVRDWLRGTDRYRRLRRWKRPKILDPDTLV